jgi:hypothetical protein
MLKFIVPPTPKQFAKLPQGKTGKGFQCPDSWAEFAPMLTIKSGKGYAKFNPYDYQIEINRLIDQHRFACLAKGRQQGLSEFCLSKILFEMLKTDGFNAVVISKTGMDSYKLGNRMIQMLDSIELPTNRKSSAEIVLKNGSRVVFTFPGDSAARGEQSVALVLLDEFSHIREAELTLSSALPATAMVEDMICLLVFTPNGKSSYSFKLLNERNPEGFDLITKIQEIRDGKEKPLYHWVDQDGWLKVLLHWKAHPIYGQNPNYLADTAKRQKMPWKKVLREYDLSFSESELQFVPDQIIDQCASLADYQPPLEGTRYYAGLDSSSVGADYFCFAVLCDQGDRLELVKLYRAKRKSMRQHLARIGKICEEYRIEACQVETNSFGQIYYEELSQDYKNVRWERFTASQGSNIKILERMLMKMEDRQLRFPPDSNIIKELRGLEADPISGKIEAGSTGAESEDGDNQLHDDIPRALSLAIRAYENRPKKSLLDLSNLIVKSNQLALDPTDPVQNTKE